MKTSTIISKLAKIDAKFTRTSKSLARILAKKSQDSEKRTISDDDIIGFGTAKTIIPSGIMSVLIKPGTPSFRRLKNKMRRRVKLTAP